MWSDIFLCLIYIFLQNLQMLNSYYKEINYSRHEKEELNKTPIQYNILW